MIDVIYKLQCLLIQKGTKEVRMSIQVQVT